MKCVDFHPTEPWTLSALYSGAWVSDIFFRHLVEVLRVCKMSPRSFLALGTNADSISPA